MVISKLKLENFKCYKKLELNPSMIENYKGRNGAGKTTIVDAIMWCLFGRNGAGTINPKPIGIGKGVIVSVVIETDIGKFQRNLKEIYTKKTGELEATYGGNATDYYINDKKVGAKEYEIMVKNIHKNLMLLINPSCLDFLEWKEKRTLLLELVDENTIIEDLKLKYGNIASFVDDFDMNLKMFKRDKNNITKEMNNTTERIDELQKFVYEDEELNTEELKEEEIRIEKIKQENEEKNKKVKALRKQITNEKEKSGSKTVLLDIAKVNLESYKRKLNSEESKKRDLKRKWQILQNIKTETKCELCGQELPTGKKEEHEKKKQEKIKEIVSEGKLVVENISKLNETIEKQIEKIKEIEKTEETCNYETIKDLEKQIEKIFETAKMPNYDRLNELKQKFATQELNKKNQVRLNELKEKLENCIEKEHEILVKIANMEKFQIEKMELIEKAFETIFHNDLGLDIQVKTNKILINGGIESCFEITVNGVDWKYVNTSAKIQVNIIVTRELSKKYCLKPFVLVDGKESVTKIPYDNRQFLTFEVDEDSIIK